MKLHDLLKSLGCEMVDITIPEKESSNERKFTFWGSADELLEEAPYPADAIVEEVSAYSTVSIECKPCTFPPEEDGYGEIGVVLTTDEIERLEALSELTPDEFIAEIVRSFLKDRTEEETDE